MPNYGPVDSLKLDGINPKATKPYTCASTSITVRETESDDASDSDNHLIDISLSSQLYFYRQGSVWLGESQYRTLDSEQSSSLQTYSKDEPPHRKWSCDTVGCSLAPYVLLAGDSDLRQADEKGSNCLSNWHCYPCSGSQRRGSRHPRRRQAGPPSSVYTRPFSRSKRCEVRWACGKLSHRGRGILGPRAALRVGVSASLRDSPEYAHQLVLCHARRRRLPCKCQQNIASRLRDWALCGGTRLVTKMTQGRAINSMPKRVQADVELRTCKYKAWR